MKPSHLGPNLMDNICSRLRMIEASLNGLGALFKQGVDDFSCDADELFGIGQLLKSLSLEISRIEDILNCGHDSMAKNNRDGHKDEGV